MRRTAATYLVEQKRWMISQWTTRLLGPLAMLIATLTLGNFAAASWSNHSKSYDSITRSYSVYTPSTEVQAVVVALHGCAQGGRDFAVASGLAAVADEKGLLLIAPEQSSSANGFRCWNWFDKINQQRDRGESGFVATLIADVRGRNNLNEELPNYLAGFSAGAALATNVSSCYPELIDAAVIHSGLQFAAATSANNAFMAMSMGSRVDPQQSAQDALACANSQIQAVPILVIHGTNDFTVSKKNGDQVVRQFVLMHDLQDDGQINRSVPHDPTQSLRKRSQRSFSVKTYKVRDQLMIRHVTIEGMGHNWSGGSGPFTDSRGPSAKQMALDFFTEIANH